MFFNLHRVGDLSGPRGLGKLAQGAAGGMEAASYLAPGFCFRGLDESEALTLGGFCVPSNGIDLKAEGEAQGDLCGVGTLSIDSNGGLFAAPEAEVEDTGNLNGGIARARLVFHFEAEGIPVKFYSCIDILDDFGYPREVSNHGASFSPGR